MPYSFTQIEKDKGRVIVLVFFSLIVFYFLTALILYWSIKGFLILQINAESERTNIPYQWMWLYPKEMIAIVSVALIVGIGHWFFTMDHLVEKMLGALRAEALNPSDKYHRMFQNIVDEVSVATGGTPMEGVVIPTMAMNAFAVADFSGRNVIGVTEGLLARLTRAEIEAVVGHEAAHIVSGDCLSATVTTSLFELYNSMRIGLGEMISSSRSQGKKSDGVVYLSYGVLTAATFMGKILRMFISRQRELRADAAAVRLTRDPLSLSQSLYTISSRWRGAGLSGENLEAIFIVNPRFSRLDESQGFFANLFSTHPPVAERLSILLDMAHSDAKVLEKKFLERQNYPRTLAPETPGASLSLVNTSSEKNWIVNKDGQWQGPFSLLDLANPGFLQVDTWVKKLGSERIEQAFENTETRDFLWKKNQQQTLLCPKCRVSLFSEAYEGASIYRCQACNGVLVHENDVERIVIRQEYDFSPRIKEIAQKLYQEASKKLPHIDLTNANLYACPQCQHIKAKMPRMLYSLVYPVVIDKCSFCGFAWFDKDELEILQCMIEQADQKNA